MATFFYELVLDARYRNETIQNLFHFSETNIALTFPDLAMITTVVNAFISQRLPDVIAIMDDDYAVQAVHGFGFDSAGNRVNVQPVIVANSSVGPNTQPQSGRARVAIASCVFNSNGAVLHTGAHLPKRGHWAIGPLAEANIGEADEFAHVGDTSGIWFTLKDHLGTPMQILGVDTWFPIKLSFTNGGAVQPVIQAWAEVGSVHWNPIVSYRRSRLNFR
jgi:hypothetical protein